MGTGACIKEGHEITWERSGKLPAKKGNSNNWAEYLALECILDELLRSGVHDELILIKGDSQLVIMQMGANWKIKSGAYISAATLCKEKIRQLVACGNKIEFRHIPRTENTYCDSLSTGAENITDERKEYDELVKYCQSAKCTYAELIAAHQARR